MLGLRLLSQGLRVASRPSLLVKNSPAKPWTCSFHTSGPKKAVPPILLALFKPLSRITAAVLGRGLRVWWKRLPEAQRLKYKAKLRQSGFAIGFGTVGFSAMMGGLYLSHVQECQLTGRKRFIALRDDQMNKIGLMEFHQMLEMYEEKLVPERHPVYAKVARVANRILRSNKDIPMVHQKDWTITVINDPGLKNALVLPSGNIFVFTGMLQVCENDDQLGFVLSHEIAHTLLEHVAQKISFVNFVHFVVLLPMALMWAIIPSDGVALITDFFFNKVIDIVFELPFSREMETEADEIGLVLAAKACFDVRQAPLFWGKMAAMEKNAPEEKVPEILRTHPTHEFRREHLTELLPQALAKRKECGCSDMLGPDPKFPDYMSHYWKNLKTYIVTV